MSPLKYLPCDLTGTQATTATLLGVLWNCFVFWSNTALPGFNQLCITSERGDLVLFVGHVFSLCQKLTLDAGRDTLRPLPCSQELLPSCGPSAISSQVYRRYAYSGTMPLGIRVSPLPRVRSATVASDKGWCLCDHLTTLVDPTEKHRCRSCPIQART